MSGHGDVLIDHVLGLHWDGLSVQAQAAARSFLHDTLAVGIAGCNAAGSKAVHALATRWSGQVSSGCGVLGRPGARATAPYAAFVNAFQIHSQEFDCVHERAVAHPLATVVAALLAQAQQGPSVAGADFLAAMVGGVDVVAALGVAATTPLKFFRPATCGIFGATAALCRMRGLGRREGIKAFGHALAFASGTMQAHVEGKPTLALQVAAAARSAVEAVDLAAAGIEAPTAAIDGPYGYLPLFEDGHDIRLALANLAGPPAITQLSWKPFPSGRAAHGGIVAIQTLMRDTGLSAATLERLTYRAPPLIARLVGRPASVSMGVAHARLCLPYLGAVTLLRGTVRLEDFSPARRSDTQVHALAERITVTDDGNTDPSAFGPASAELTLRDGRRVVLAVERQFGSPEWPLSPEQQSDKARECLAFGGMPDAHAALADAVRTLDRSRDAALSLGCVFGEEDR